MSESTQIQADLPLTVTLPASMWRVVVTQLSKASIETLGPTYGEIDRQLYVQVQQFMQHRKLNGEATDQGGQTEARS